MLVSSPCHRSGPKPSGNAAPGAHSPNTVGMSGPCTRARSVHGQEPSPPSPASCLSPAHGACSPGPELPIFYLEAVVESCQEANQPCKPEQERPEWKADGGVSQGCLHSHRHPVPACVGPGASEAREALSRPAGYEAQTGNHRKVRPGEACAECRGDPEAVASLGLGSTSSEAGCTSKEGPFSADRSGLSWGLGAVAEAGLSRLLPCPSPPPQREGAPACSFLAGAAERSTMVLSKPPDPVSQSPPDHACGRGWGGVGGSCCKLSTLTRGPVGVRGLRRVHQREAQASRWGREVGGCHAPHQLWHSARGRQLYF